jgi:hypothetical protein
MVRKCRISRTRRFPRSDDVFSKVDDHCKSEAKIYGTLLTPILVVMGWRQVLTCSYDELVELITQWFAAYPSSVKGSYYDLRVKI